MATETKIWVGNNLNILQETRRQDVYELFHYHAYIFHFLFLLLASLQWIMN